MMDQGSNISGFTLHQTYARVHFSASRRLDIYLHENSIPPRRLTLDPDAISVHEHVVSLDRSRAVNVVEHLFSALYGLRIFNLRIDLYGNEIPFFDGSSYPFIMPLARVKTNAPAQPSHHIPLLERISVGSGNSFIRYEPARTRRDPLVVDMTLSHPYIKKQRIELEVTPRSYRAEIAPARTFVFTTEDDPRLKELPPYGIGITRRNIYSASPLRFPDEPVRHKILDLLGDMFVLRKMISGKIIARNTSHRLNLRFVKTLLGYLDFDH
ncbi:MAG TPA: UDP-3-O-acyl-N-acetylglucosamine deacetylase [bacterium]